MKCPYCAEDIKDEAIVCHYCKRDLSFFKPLEARVKSLEERYSQIAESVVEIGKTLEALQVNGRVEVAKASSSRSNLKYIYFVLAVLLPILSSAGIFWLRNYIIGNLREDSMGGGSYGVLIVFNTILFAVPIIFGFLLGLKWQGFHFRSYIVLGSIIGVLEIIIGVTAFHVIDTFMMHALVIARAALGFTSGALFGDWIERKVFPDTVKSGFADRIAQNLISKSTKIPVEGTNQGIPREERVKRLASIIAALAPFLTLIGSIVSAYFTYLGALAKKP